MKETDLIIKLVEREFNIDNILTKSRERQYIDARMFAYQLMRDLDYSLVQIGRRMNKNHATVLWAVKQFGYIREFDLDVSNRYDSLYVKLKEDYELVLDTNRTNDNLNDMLKRKLDKVIQDNERITKLYSELKETKEETEFDDVFKLIRSKLNPRNKEAFYIKANGILNGLIDK